MPNDSASSIYDLDCTDLHGHPVSMNSFRGHPILIVNTASLCGFSVQFKGLEDVWNENKDKGLVVLGVPTGDFGRQELGSNAEIVTMCSTKFGITFPLLAKTQVHGKGAHPLFQWLAEEGGFLARPRWNFYKYFISADGRLQNWFSTLTPPTSPRFARAVTELTAAA
jgi:glutathione peroxidase